MGLNREEFAADSAEKFIIDHLPLDRWNVSPLDPKADHTAEDRYTVRSPWRTGENHTMKENPRWKTYAEYEETEYATLKTAIKKFLIRRSNLPIGRGKRLRGVPLHFSTSEPEKIREYLQTCEKFNQFKDLGSEKGQVLEDVAFTVACHAERLAGQILSVWFYIA